MAELDDLAKDAISHRGRALRVFAEWYADAPGPGAGAS
jgi:inosine/xanthosine triphosphate pyrophosphatase family protein